MRARCDRNTIITWLHTAFQWPCAINRTGNERDCFTGGLAVWQIEQVLGVVVILFGLVVGSFLNVCILRLPAGESIVRPRSRCPACGAMIAAGDNIPVVSYLLLRGRCRHCQARISVLYPAVELTTAILFWAECRAFGLHFLALKWMVFTALIIVLVAIDVRERLLPDAVTFLGAPFGLAFSLFLPPSDGSALWLSSRWFDYPPPQAVLALADALFGAAAGAGLLWIIAEGYFRVRRREGMGRGDVKMMMMAGTFLGFWRALLTIAVGAVLGALLGGAFILVRRKQRGYPLPFGAFLGIAALGAIFFGSPIVGWYQGLIGGG